MRIDTIEGGFAPCSITFNFETAKELEAFSVMFHYYPVVEALRKHAGTKFEIYRSFAELGASSFGLINGTVFVNELKKQMKDRI